MKTVIAEKPSVARELAYWLGATEKKEGYLTGNGYCVTWALGHLVDLGMPEDYGISGFQKESLPVLPNPFLLTVRKVKKSKNYRDGTNALNQLKIIEQLLNSCDSIIVATDAGREGELIFRYIYSYLKCNKPFQRLWMNSLTEKAIRRGFDNLKPGSDFDGLFQAAQSRSRADWLVGINASQALSVAAGNGTYSLGRVQTPTLAMICKRYVEHTNFKSQKYWQLQLEHQKDFFYFKSLSTNKWQNKKSAEEALKSILRNKMVTVKEVINKTITEQPPLLYDLTGLQKDANKKLNFSAEETLSIAQKLYEKKFITYPRTGSKHIPNDIWHEIPELIRLLEIKDRFKAYVNKIKFVKPIKRIVNDLKVTDHHGLLITHRIPSALSVKEEAIYQMIASRLLEAVSPSCIRETIDVTLQVLHYDFRLKGSKILEPGWREVNGHFSEEGSNESQDLPNLQKGDELKIKNAVVLEKKTRPPLLYSEAGLLSAMENAGKEIENGKERKALQNIGIGTPATRATIIETLFKRKYIKRQNKCLVPTEKGIQVYLLVKDKKIADVSMTANWELTLQKIEKKEIDAEIFQKEMETYATLITNELLQTTIAKENLPKLLCPKCQKRQIIIKDKIVKCPDKDCGWFQFRNICGVQMTLSDIESLIKKKKTPLIKGMKSRSGKIFDAYIVLNENAKSYFEFENTKMNKK